MTVTHGFTKPASAPAGIDFNGLGTSFLAPGDGTKPEFTILIWAKRLSGFGFRSTSGGRVYFYWNGVGNPEVGFYDDTLVADVVLYLQPSDFDNEDFHFLAVRHRGGTADLFFDGVIVDTESTAAWSPLLADPSSGWLLTGGAWVSTAANFAVFDRGLESSEIYALFVAGIRHDYTEAYGGLWAGEVPPWYLRDSGLSNAGDGGAIAASFASGASAVALPDSTSPVVPTATADTRSLIRRIGTRAAPPLHSFYTLTGSVGSMLLPASTAMARLFFPLAGGLGQAMFRFWFRRPVTPVTTGGTLGQVTVGDATITVGLDATEHPTVTVSDGAITLSDTATDPLGGRAWRQLTFVADGALDRLRVYLNATLVAEVDTSTMTFDPDIETGMSFTVGTKTDGTVPIDVDIIGVAGVAGIDSAGVSDADIEELSEGRAGLEYLQSAPAASTLASEAATAGHSPDPGLESGAGWDRDIPDPGYTIVAVYGDPEPGSIVDGEGGYVPETGTTERWDTIDTGGGDAGGGLIAFIVTQEDFVSEFWAWTISTHRIGVYSTAWWPGFALIASNWHLTYDTGEVTTGERVFGECPRVARVTERADGVLLVDVDAVLQPRVTYVLAVDVDDLAANNPGDMSVDGPVPAREHTADLVPALLDIDAPLRAGLRVTDSGDFGMASETRTVEKMLWALVLTPRGSVDWDPQFGSALRAKRLRPMDLKQEHRRLVALAMGVPYVKAAAVQLLFEGDEIVVEFNITSDFGSFYTRRAVDAS